MFEPLEEFHVILNELVGDESMAKIRVEYEKLLHALQKSRENEKRLMSKCRELNAEVVSTSTKVAAALQLSHEDETTIASLKRVYGQNTAKPFTVSCLCYLFDYAPDLRNTNGWSLFSEVIFDQKKYEELSFSSFDSSHYISLACFAKIFLCLHFRSWKKAGKWLMLLMLKRRGTKRPSRI